MFRTTLSASPRMLPLVALVVLGSSPGSTRAQAAACDSKIRTLEINGTTLHYVDCGEGDPLVFVHGSLGDLHTFQRQLPTFAKTFRVIAYSRRFAPPNAPPRWRMNVRVANSDSRFMLIAGSGRRDGGMTLL